VTRFRDVIDRTLHAHDEVGAPAAWVLSNHDVTRHVTRYGRAGDTGFTFADRRHGVAVDLALGTRRARAAALLTLALPGGMYVYQGEELGLWEIEDIPDALRQDPVFARTHGVDPGRDGCRVPFPWSGSAPPFGFGPSAWLPRPPVWASYTAEVQSGDPASMLELYRAGLRIRAKYPADSLRWLPLGDDVLAFAREGFTFVLNFADAPLALPPHQEILLASGPLTGDLLPTDTAVWLRS